MMRWAEHVARIVEKCNVSRMLVCNLKRRACMKETWIYLKAHPVAGPFKYSNEYSGSIKGVDFRSFLRKWHMGA
jgi:hypothetical protein